MKSHFIYIILDKLNNFIFQRTEKTLPPHYYLPLPHCYLPLPHHCQNHQPCHRHCHFHHLLLQIHYLLHCHPIKKYYTSFKIGKHKSRQEKPVVYLFCSNHLNRIFTVFMFSQANIFPILVEIQISYTLNMATTY